MWRRVRLQGRRTLDSFWSPDSQTVAFFADNKLKKITVVGGPPVTLAEPVLGIGGGSWNREGVIVLSARLDRGAGLWRLSDSGGDPTLLPVSQHLQMPQRWPAFLPDQKHFLFHQADGIYVADLESPNAKRLASDPTLSRAVYAAPGYLMFVRQDTLVAQPFDTVRLELTGGAVPVAAHIATLQGAAPFSIADDGMLVYRAGFAATQLTWFDRGGRPLSTVGPRGAYINPSLSPDGQRLAFARAAQSWDVWIMDLTRGIESRDDIRSRH